MITRRTALSMLPAGLMTGSSFISLARAEPATPTFRPNTNAAREILSKVDQSGRTPHHEATKALINSYIRVATLRNTATDARKFNSKAELSDALAQHDAMYGAVTVAIDSRKKTDDVIDKETGPLARRISEGDKIKLGSVIDIKNNEMKQLLTDLFSGPSGEFEPRRASSTKIARLNVLSEELLKAGRDMATWGPDAFYAMARGYATFQFVRYCTRVGGSTSGSSAILARAYTLKVIGDSESYCAFQAAALVTPATTTSPALTTGTTTPGQLSWTDRHDVERDLINKNFPKEIYLGSQSGRDARCDTRGRRVRNFYGIFTDNSNFERGFRSDGVTASDCVATLNDRRKEALNNLLGDRLKFPGPTTGTLDQFKDTMRSVEQSLNDHIAFLKRQKQKENPDSGAGAGTSQPPPPPSDASNEFKVMQQMAAYLREALALT